MFDDEVSHRGGGPGAEAAPGSGTGLGAVVEVLVDRSAVLADADLAGPGGRELLRSVADLVRVARRVDAAIAAGAWSLERSKASEAVSGLSVGSWLAAASHGCGGEGAWRVRAGRLMERFERLGRAVRDGELGLEHLRVLDEVRDPSVADLLAHQDGDLLDVALANDLAVWRREVRARASLLRDELERRSRAEQGADGAPGEQPDDRSAGDVGDDLGQSAGEPEGAEEPSGDQPGDPTDGSDPGDRSGPAEGGASPDGAGEESAPGEPEGWLSVRPTAGGGLLVRGELFGEPAEMLRQALLAEASRQWRASWIEHDRTDSPLPAAGELRARALCELVRRGLAVDLDSSTGPRTDAVIVLTVDHDRLAGRVRALDGEPLPVEVAAQLACDANLQALLVGAAGQPLWMGRSTRLATAAQRRALAIRDGGCVFPGCTMPADWCDVHHQPGWQHGGRSDLDQMVLLCRRHHGAVHTGRWTLRAVPEAAVAHGPPDDPCPCRGHGPSGDVDLCRGDGSPPDASVRPGVGPPGQRYEWHDNHAQRRLPARQRGLRPAA